MRSITTFATSPLGVNLQIRWQCGQPVHFPKPSRTDYVKKCSNGAVRCRCQSSWFFLRINGPFDAGNRVFFNRFDDAGGLIPVVSMVLSPLSSNLPVPVNNLTATVTSASSISLSWNDNSANEKGFVIERRLHPSWYG